MPSCDLQPFVQLHRLASTAEAECVVGVIKLKSRWFLNVCWPRRAICNCLLHRKDESTEYLPWMFQCDEARDFVINDFCFCYGITKQLFVELINAWLAYHEALERVRGLSVCPRPPVDQNHLNSLLLLQWCMKNMVDKWCQHCQCKSATCTANVIRKKQLQLQYVLSGVLREVPMTCE